MALVSPRVEFIPPPGWDWLASEVRDLKGDDPFRPVTIVVPNAFAGRLAQDYLARDRGYLNVHVELLARVVGRLAPAGLRGPLTPIVEAGVVRAAIRLSGAAFAPIDHGSLRRALIERFRELRRLEIDAPDLAPPTTAARAFFEVYATYRQLVDGYDTPSSRARAAARRLDEAPDPPTELLGLGSLILFLPTRLDPPEARFLAAAARSIPLVAAFPGFGDPRGPGDEPGREDAARLALALGIELAEPEPPSELPHFHIIRAPDPTEEVREVVRAIARDLEDGIALDRIAVVYRDDDPYAALVRDALDTAGFPWISSEGIRLSDTRRGRCLLDLLALPERSFTREAVLQWLETGPLLAGSIAAVSAGAWDRLSRLAGVTRGAEQWVNRLRRLATSLEDSAGPDDDSQSPWADARRSEAASARTIADFVSELSVALAPPPSDSGWAAYVDWALRLSARYVGASTAWPSALAPRAGAVEAAIRELAAGDGMDEGPDFAVFRELIGEALAGGRVRTGEPGDGILVEPLVAMMGLAVERLYLLGLREGAYPAPLPVDPFFPDDDCDPLRTRARQPTVERRDFLVGLTAVHGSHPRVTLGVPDSDDTRPAFPSRWLLDLVGDRLGRRLDAESFRGLPESDWLRVIRSAQDGVLRAVAPADLEDRRLGDLASWRASGLSPAAHPLCQRSDLPLGSALDLARERASERFTAFDGNVSARSAARRLALDPDRPASASAFETWATCGYRYFLRYVLGVEPTTRPEEQLGLDPRDRGSLIHDILDEFFRALRSAGRPRPDEAYNADDVAELEAIAERKLDRWERRGAIGYVLSWESERAAILADLRLFLQADAPLRRQGGWVPTSFEQPFGSPGSSSWPPLEVALPSDALSSPLRFRGILDRVDLDESGRRAWAYDYKTGSAEGFRVLASDPVAAGTHLQLALYRRAIEANLPNVTSVGASYWFVTSRGRFERHDVADDPRVDERLDAVLASIVRGIRSGAFPPVPGAPVWPATFANCRWCDFDRVCPAQRGRYWERKRGDPLAALHLQLAPAGQDGAGEGE